MLLRADTRFSDEQQLRRDDLRNQLLSFNNNSNGGIESDPSNVWDALPGSKWGSCTDLLNAPKSRPLPKALQPKSPKDEQRSLSFSYRAPVLALPPTLPLTKAPTQSDQRHSTQRARVNSFGGFSSQTTLSSAPSRAADDGFDGADNHIWMPRHEASPERNVTSYPVTLQRSESPCGTKAPLPGTAQAHAQMLWIEKARRGSEPCSEYTGKEPLWSSKAKETYRNDPSRERAGTHIETELYRNNLAKEPYSHYVQEERSRNNTSMEPRPNHQEKEQRWNDTNEKQHSGQTESKPHYTTGLEIRLKNNGKGPEIESHWNHNVENEPRFNYAGTETRWTNREKEPYWKKPANEPYFSYAELETNWNNPEKVRCLADPVKESRCKSQEKELSWNNKENELQSDKREKYSSGLNYVESDSVWKNPEAQPSIRNSSEKEPLRNSKERKSSYSDTEKEQHWSNGMGHPHTSLTETESHWNIIAKEPHRNGEERIQRWNKEPQLNSNVPRWNNPENESNWSKKIKEPRSINSEGNRHPRPSDSTILPSRYTPTSPSARPCNGQRSSSVEPTALFPQRSPMAQQQPYSGDDLRLMTSPLYKLSSFRYGSGRESPIGVQQKDEGRVKDNLPNRTPFDGKAIDSQASGRTSRDRALSQGALPRVLNKYLSGSAIDLSRGYDDPRGSSDRTLPRTSEGRIPSGTNQVPSSTKQISDRWRTLDRAQGTSNRYITGSSGQSPSALYKARNRWASLDREGQGQESKPRRTDESGPGNAAQRTNDRRNIFEPSNRVTENKIRKLDDSSRPASSHVPTKPTSARDGQDRATTISNRGSCQVYTSPIIRSRYGSETNLASLGGGQDPSYLAMASSRYPSGRSYDLDKGVSESDRYQSETLRLSSPRLNQAQPSGTAVPLSTVQMKLIPQRSTDLYSTMSNGQSEDVTRSVSSFNQMEPATESSNGNRTYMHQFTDARDSKSAKSCVSYNPDVGREPPTRPFGTPVEVQAHPWRETKAQMSDGSLTEDSGIGFSESNIRSSSASPKDELKLNREIMMDEERLIRGDPTTLGGSAMLNHPYPFVGQSIGVSPSRCSEKDYARKRRDESEANNAKEIFTKEDWIRSARQTGKSPTPVENKSLNVGSYDRRTEVLGREASARSSDLSATPGVWKTQLDNMGASTRKDGGVISSTEQYVKQDYLNATPPKTTAEKWREFLNGSVETKESTGKVLEDQRNLEWHRESTTAVGESLGQEDKEGGRAVQQTAERKEASRTSRADVKQSEDNFRWKGNQLEDFVVSRTPLERPPVSERSSILENSNVEDRIRRDGKIEDTIQDGKGDERNVENCNGGVQGLREVEIYVQRGALGVGFCVEGGLQSTAGDRPIIVKRIFAGADGHLRGKLRTGDEILRVNDKDFRQISHYNAWNFLKTLPEGPAKLLIFAK